MVGRFPGANSIAELWQNLCAGKESIAFFEEDEIDPSIARSLIADPNYVPAKGVLAGAELFGAGFFGVGIREAQVMDPQARIFVELAYEAIENAGYTNDGADKVSFTAPSVNGQMGAILQAQHAAGIEPATISYIEAHGTATALGDPIEVEALTQAFRTQTPAKQFCGIGSIKSNLGHLTAAAGVAGFIKTVLAIYHRQIPPSINFDRPNPHIDFANSPLWDLPAGAMLSVRLPAVEIAARLTPELAIAAINSPVLCVVSGATEAIAQLQQELEPEEIVCKLLHTSHAFHSPMMAPIVAPFAESIANMQLSPPQIPFISLVTADWITDEQAISPSYWADHLVKPVRFAEGVQKLWQQNPNFVLLEVGSRQTLTTLARQQASRHTQIAIASLAIR